MLQLAGAASDARRHFRDSQRALDAPLVMQIAAITGLAAEARIARRAGLRPLIAGGEASPLSAAIGGLASEGVGGVVSLGICGGLDPALGSGTLLLPRAVRTEEGRRFLVDDGWRTAVASGLRGAGTAFLETDLLGTASIVGTASDKAALFAKFAAGAVDLESHVAADAAQSFGIPFIALRVVADPAWHGLPAAALIPLDAEGRPFLGRVLRSIADRPAQIPELVRVAFETRRALGVLRRVARFVASGLTAAISEQAAPGGRRPM